MKKDYNGLNSRAVHAGERVDKTTRALSTPIYATNTFAYANFQEFIDAGLQAYPEDPDDFEFFYTRTSNPTTVTLEKKLAAIIGSEGSLVTSTGMAAITLGILAKYQSGTKILVSNTLYRSTHHLLEDTLPRLGIKSNYIDFRDLDELEKQFQSDEYSVAFFESPANPTMRCYDIKEICELAHHQDITVVFDNTFATPICQQPLVLGVDFDIHSATKYLNGHGDAMGGVIAGKMEELTQIRRVFGETFGPTPSPFNSFLILRGMKTLGLRVNKQCFNALEVAKYLEEHEKITKVYYPGLPSHPEHDIAKKQMSEFGGMLAFELEDVDYVTSFLNNRLKMIKLAMDVGYIGTLIEFPSYQTHFDVDYELKQKIGITDELLRLSVGIEDLNDIIADLDQALKQI
ncbi:MAG: trans-sulfuration enzyme family protein [Candidatus Hodarchaeales archaeon]|jgi:methionine-gamma-lyase